MAAKSKSNTTQKGTKQRSFNLDDTTFAIVVETAKRFHLTNSGALGVIIHSYNGEGSATVQLTEPAEPHTAVPDPKPRGGSREIALPDPKAGSFTVDERTRKVRARHLADDDVLGSKEDH